MAHNKLKSLPAMIGDLQQIQKLYVSHNCIAEIPESIKKLAQLEVLHLDSNRFCKLPAVKSNSLSELTLDWLLYARTPKPKVVTRA